MKKLIMGLLPILLLCLTNVGYGQTQTYRVQTPKILAGGDFNNDTDTGLHTWSAAQMPLYTVRDTVRNANGAGDSVRLKLVGECNSLTLEVHATLDSGSTGCDSVIVQFRGTATEGNGQGSFALLQGQSTLAAVNGSDQVFVCLVNSGNGNPYTNYRVTVDVLDAVNTCRVSWKARALIR